MAYAGPSVASRRQVSVYVCPCGKRLAVELWRVVNAGDPAAAALFAGQLNRARCPACEREAEVQVTVVYHDPAREYLVLVLPDGLRHRELEERAGLYLQLAKDGVPPPDYIVGFQVVFGGAALVRELPPAPPPVAAIPLTVQRPVPVPKPVAPPPPEEDLPEDTGRTTVRVFAPEAASPAIERWIAERAAPILLVEEGRILVCAALPYEQLEALMGAPLRLTVQSSRGGSYPLVMLAIGPDRPVAGAPPLGVELALDVGRAVDRAALELLAQRAEVTLLLYDAEYLPVQTRILRTPIETQAVRALAEARRQTPVKVDLRSLASSELVGLLGAKERRSEAAMLLLERGEVQHLPAVLNALGQMVRGEAIRILPLLVRSGAAAERFLLTELDSQKAFLRHGCALALGALAKSSPNGAKIVEELVRRLLQEPTEIWPEIARVLGDLGPQSVMPLVLKLRFTSTEGRERIARALGHIAQRGIRGPVEMMAAGDDPASGAVARRALALVDEIAVGESEVRGPREVPPRQLTVVRAFSRRFFQSLRGEAPPEDDLFDRSDIIELPPERTGDTDRLQRLPEEHLP